MFADLRQWDEAKAFAQASKNVDATELTRKQAEWAEETSDWSAAADLQVSAGNALQAVRLLHEHKPEGWIEKLSLIVRQVTAEDVLRQCARAFLANGADRCGNHAIDARFGEHGRVFAEEGLREEWSGAPTPVDAHTGEMKGPRRSMLN